MPARARDGHKQLNSKLLSDSIAEAGVMSTVAMGVLALSLAAYENVVPCTVSQHRRHPPPQHPPWLLLDTQPLMCTITSPVSIRSARVVIWPPQREQGAANRRQPWRASAQQP